MTTKTTKPTNENAPGPPIAKRTPRIEELHGERRVDDYHWLREKDSPDVLDYLRRENAYTDAVMAGTVQFQEKLYSEMLARIKETDLSVPYRLGAYYWYSRTEQGKQYPIYCRKKGSLDAPEEVTLDLNAIGETEKYVGLGVYVVSEDGNWLAYSLDTSGFRVYTLYIKDLRTGEIGLERIERVDSAAWAADDRTLFYVTENDAKRPFRLHRHLRGTLGDDPLLYEETDEMFGLTIAPSRSRAFLFAGSHSHTTSEVRVLRADDPYGQFRLIAPRQADHEYDVDHRSGLFYIRTNGGGRRNFRIVTAPEDDPDPARWKEIVPHRDDVMIEGIELFAGHSVVWEREDGLQRIRITDFGSGASHRIEFPEAAYAVFPGANPEFELGAYRYSYQSFTTPPSVFDYDVRSRERTLLKQEEVLGGYDPGLYRVERLHAAAADGALIPISVAFRKDARRDGAGPMLLYGYGSYGYPLPVGFSSMRLSLLDRGIAFAIAHVRGGGEMGKKWHDEGRMMAKSNTFSDFIAAAEFLVARGYTSNDRLIIEGGSAGGLLIGAVLNMRPDLCKAAVMMVPFVDVVNTMLDTSLPLTVGEFEEWGNPAVLEQYRTMRSYSPYDNLEPKVYPAILVMTSYNDSQVMYWEPAKWVALLRARKTDSNPLLLRMDLAPSGHGGRSCS